MVAEQGEPAGADGQRDGEEPEGGWEKPGAAPPPSAVAWAGLGPPFLTRRHLSRRRQVEPGVGAGAGCLPFSFSGKRSVRLWRKLFFQMKEPFLERDTGEREKERKKEGEKERKRPSFPLFSRESIHSWTIFIKLKKPQFHFLPITAMFTDC